MLTHKLIGRQFGDRLPLQEIQKIAAEAQKNLTEEEEQELRKELETHRHVMKGGVRCNNVAANLNFQSTVTRIGAEVRTHLGASSNA